MRNMILAHSIETVSSGSPQTAEGGDIRGRQSAAILIVKPVSTGRPWADKVFDLRVEDHALPLKELRRLVNLQRAYNHMSAGDDCVTVKDWACAEREYGAAEGLVPDNAEMAFWHAVALATNGRLDAARPLFARAFAADARWRERARSFIGIAAFTHSRLHPLPREPHPGRRPRAARRRPRDREPVRGPRGPPLPRACAGRRTPCR